MRGRQQSLFGRSCTFANGPVAVTQDESISGQYDFKGETLTLDSTSDIGSVLFGKGYQRQD